MRIRILMCVILVAAALFALTACGAGYKGEALISSRGESLYTRTGESLGSGMGESLYSRSLGSSSVSVGPGSSPGGSSSNTLSGSYYMTYYADEYIELRFSGRSFTFIYYYDYFSTESFHGTYILDGSTLYLTVDGETLAAEYDSESDSIYLFDEYYGYYELFTRYRD